MSISDIEMWRQRDAQRCVCGHVYSIHARRECFGIAPTLLRCACIEFETSGAGEAPTSLDGDSGHLARVAAARPGADEDDFGGDAPEMYVGPPAGEAMSTPTDRHGDELSDAHGWRSCLSPDCAITKHGACSGDAWDNEDDHLVSCGCDCHRSVTA